jgi:hypothetical protein
MAHDCRAACSRHFSIDIEPPMPGMFARLPFTRLSAWIEWSAPNAGLGFHRSTEVDLEFFLWTVRGVLSVEPKHERGAA